MGCDAERQRKKILFSMACWWLCKSKLVASLHIDNKIDVFWLILFLSNCMNTSGWLLLNWIFSTVFRRIFKYQISWKSVRWEPSSSTWTDGRTDMTKLIMAFRNFRSSALKLSPATSALSHMTLWRVSRRLHLRETCHFVNHLDVIALSAGS